MLIGMTVACVLLGGIGRYYVRMLQQEAVAESMANLGGRVYYEHEFALTRELLLQDPPGPSWLRDLFGENLFATLHSAEVSARTGEEDRAVEALHLLEQLPDLQTLDLVEVPLGRSEVEVLVALPKLRQLTISDCPISDENWQRLMASRSLEIVSLSYKDLHPAKIASLRSLPSLRELEIWTHRNDPASVEAIFRELQTLQQLKSLALRTIPIDNKQMVAIAQLKELRSLDIKWELQSRFDDEGFAALESLRHLTHIKLPLARIGGASMEVVSRMPSVETLEIPGSFIEDDDMVHLAGHPSLKRLDICQTRITDEGLQHLKSAPQLCELGLLPDWGVAVTMDGLKDAGFIEYDSRVIMQSKWFERTPPAARTSK
ncbi:hypothetical protein GCM10023155_24090 [Bremerella cremea]